MRMEDCVQLTPVQIAAHEFCDVKECMNAPMYDIVLVPHDGFPGLHFLLMVCTEHYGALQIPEKEG